MDMLCFQLGSEISNYFAWIGTVRHTVDKAQKIFVWIPAWFLAKYSNSNFANYHNFYTETF